MSYTILPVLFVCILVFLAAVAISKRQLGPGQRRPTLSSQTRDLAQLTPGPSDDPNAPPPILFSRYNTTELARGGVGTVYRARHPVTGQTYAIKRLNHQFNDDQLVVEAFHRGAAMLTAMRHPNIVRVFYDWVEHQSSTQEHFVIMEFLPGHTLHEVIHSHAPFTLDDWLVNVIHDIGDAVSYLHAHEIIHRDIKPENFRLSEGRFKLLDFDTAIPLEQRRFVLQDGKPIGTPEYMSPEQARGIPDIDVRADVYSFGMLLFELFTGSVPFTGAPSRVLIDQMRNPPPSPATFTPGIPDSISQIVLMALEKERERRFQSIQAILTAVDTAYAQIIQSRS